VPGSEQGRSTEHWKKRQSSPTNLLQHIIKREKQRAKAASLRSPYFSTVSFSFFKPALEQKFWQNKNRKPTQNTSEIRLSKQKTKKSQKQELMQKEKKAESKNVQKLIEGLDELRKKGKYCDVAVWPKCKNINLRRVNSMKGDITGHMGWLPAIYECLDCG
jgi:hypothetical protein